MSRAIAALVAILSLALVPSALAADAGHLEILAPDAPGILKFDELRMATLSVTIRNATSSDVTVTTRFVDSATGATTDSSSPVPARAGLVALVAPVGAVTISHGDTRIVDVRVAAGPDRDLTGIAGVVVFETIGSDVTGATLAVAASKPDPFAGTRVEPAKLTINGNRTWPSVIPSDCDCWADWIEGPIGAARFRVSIAGATKVDGLTEMKALLASDTGGRLEVSLRDFALDENGKVTAAVRLNETDRAGTYTGTLSVNPDDPKAAAIDLTVNVQDLFVWPLVAVLFGEGLAYMVAYWRDRRRARQIVEIKLGEAKAAYDLAASKPAGSAGGLTERQRSWFAGIFSPPPQTPDSESRADKALKAIRFASSKVDLEAAAEEASEIVAIWESLPSLSTAETALSTQLEASRHVDPLAAVFTHASELLSDRDTGFATSADAKRYGLELGDQAAAIDVVKRAYTELERGERMWADLVESARAALFRENPVAYWQEAIRPLRTRQELNDDDILQQLRDRNVAILGYLLAHPNAMSRQPDDRTDLGGFMYSIQEYATAPKGVGVEDLLSQWGSFQGAAEPVVRPVIWQDPEQLLVQVRRFDMAEFWLSFALGLVTAFLLLYQDKNFGTGWQYLGAITSGFGATTAVLQLLPWYRTYKPDQTVTQPA